MSNIHETAIIYEGAEIAEDVVILPMPVIPVQPVTATLILREAENLVDIVPCVR